MRTKQQILDAVTECGIVAVVRGESAEPVFKAIDAVLKGGVNVVEVTFTVPGALEIIRQLAKQIPDNVVLGAGTVLSAGTAGRPSRPARSSSSLPASTERSCTSPRATAKS